MEKKPYSPDTGLAEQEGLFMVIFRGLPAVSAVMKQSAVFTITLLVIPLPYW